MAPPRVSGRNHGINPARLVGLLVCAGGILVSGPAFADDQKLPQMSPEAVPLPSSTDITNMFLPGPYYGPDTYNAPEATGIYGYKWPIITQRPLLELGRELYVEGPFQESPTILGKKNLMLADLQVFGDWRTAVGQDDNGGKYLGTVATRVDLDIDLKLTATERFHVFLRPFERNGELTRVDFDGNDHDAQGIFNPNPLAYFFEGDLARITAGITDHETALDLPFTVGLIPLLFQNGIWVQDAFLGGAFTIPAKHSTFFDISNFDITFFGGVDQVDSPAIINNGQPALHNDLVGFNAFIEALQGYFEIGYGYTKANGGLDDLSYHNFAIAYSRRYRDWWSNSLRFILNEGQKTDAGVQPTAKGELLLMENSLIGDSPYFLLPYLNLFAGFDRPQPLARGPGTGGVLVNTGILFETDGLTGLPTLNATAANRYGGAFGVEHIFFPTLSPINVERHWRNLVDIVHRQDQQLLGPPGEQVGLQVGQLVLETAVVKVMDDTGPNRDTTLGDEFGVGARFQYTLSNAWIFRADVMHDWRDFARDSSGARVEVRMKF